MAVTIPRGKTDPVVDAIRHSLNEFQLDHPLSHIELYRQNSVSVRIKIVDSGFHGQSRSQRSRYAWSYFAKLPEEIQNDISTVLLLTPDEAKTSFANVEFDNPIPSKL